MWRALDDFASNVCEPWILVGDFKFILDGPERQDRASREGFSWDLFKSFIFKFGHKDMGFLGPHFT